MQSINAGPFYVISPTIYEFKQNYACNSICNLRYDYEGT